MKLQNKLMDVNCQSVNLWQTFMKLDKNQSSCNRREQYGIIYPNRCKVFYDLQTLTK